MTYTDLTQKLANLFDLAKSYTIIPESNTAISTFEFESDNQQNSDTPLVTPKSETDDNLNRKFRIAVFHPKGKSLFKDAIILLHGLNERSWLKYLPWAYTLSERTNKPVILFPFAYHMNRSPITWAQPQSMFPLTKVHSTEHPENSLSSYLNLALSKRLGQEPDQFVKSGIQTYTDIVNFIKHSKAGNSPLFEKGCNFDLFSYSIGALLSEILMFSNPSNLFSKSRLFIFCGGPTFNHMDASSRYILDKWSFNNLQKAMFRFAQKQIIPPFTNLQAKTGEYFTPIWKAFVSLLGKTRFKDYREKQFVQLAPRIRALILENDLVMAADGILKTLHGDQQIIPIQVSVENPDYKYTHENPFPINTKQRTLVDEFFAHVFKDASKFLA